MNVSMKTYAAILLPWELTVEGPDGVAYATRPPTIGDLAAIEAALGGRVTEVKDVAALARSLFVEPAPDVSTWGYELVVLAMTAIVEHFTEVSKKNVASVQAARAAAAATKSSGAASLKS